MSAAGIPYHLRPHKAVDRRIFLDLLSRCERWQPLQDFAYVSMGAYALEDHKAIHRRFGVSRLVAFDYDAGVVQRQIFNRPTVTCQCLHKKSGDIVFDFDKTLREIGFSNAEGAVVWLDFTSAKDLGTQLREVHTLLEQLAPSDIVRVTLNAKAANLGEPKAIDERRPSREEVDAHRFEVLSKRVGDYLPSKASALSVSQKNYPQTLALALRAAVTKAFAPSDPYTFSLLSLVTYADQQPMLSMTGMKISRTDDVRMRTALSLDDWPFYSPDWFTIHTLAVADLTVRERLFLEREVLRYSPAQTKDHLGFDLDMVTEVDGFLSSFKKYHRFYPTFLSADV